MAEGVVFAIEEFAVHDGPGIRKTVFLKGCPLNCNWCHNPEGLSFSPELVKNTALCQGCGRCQEACSHIRCIACGDCVSICPLRLRRICGRVVDSVDLAAELINGSDVLINSGGGITLSGGEPLAQPEFAIDLIHLLKPMHIAIETSGYAKNDVFSSICNLVDLIMLDIKHVDSEQHRLMTGVSNHVILHNLEWLKASGNSFIVRIPLIPGFSDTQANLEATAALLQGSANLIRVELLPYHRTAGAKYAMVGRQYAPRFDPAVTPRIVQIPFNQAKIRSVVL